MPTTRFTLFTGQWADLPLEEVCRLARDWGYDGLELACWGDHFEVDKALAEDGYLAGRHALLAKYGLQVLGHLQPPGRPGGLRPPDRRAAPGHPARPDLGRRRARGRPAAGRRARCRHRAGRGRVRGRDRRRLHRLLDLAHGRHVPAGAAGDDRARLRGLRRAVEPDPGRLRRRRASGSRTRCTPARSPTTTGPPAQALEAVGHRPAFGLNFDPSHFVWQDLDPVGFLCDFRDRIYHVDCKEARKRLDGRNGRLGSHLPGATRGAAGTSCPPGHGDVPWEDVFRMLNSIGYGGPISVEWEDAGMDRLAGRPGGAGLPEARSTSSRRRRPSTPRSEAADGRARPPGQEGRSPQPGGTAARPAAAYALCPDPGESSTYCHVQGLSAGRTRLPSLRCTGHGPDT